MKTRVSTWLVRGGKGTRNSAVAVIADRTAYDARHTGKLSNRFRLQVYKRPGMHDPIQRVEFMNAPKLYLSLSDRLKFTESLNNRT